MTQINKEAENVACSQMATGDRSSGGTWDNPEEQIKGKKCDIFIKLSER